MLEFVQVFLRRLASLFRRRGLEDDLDEELRSHLEMAVELNVRKGMAPEDARSEARRSFGGVEQTKEAYRDQRGLPMIETMLQDLRFGLRMLRRSPGFSVLAILCLTLGIGANAAVFSWIEGILFRPYPAVAHQESLVAVGGTSRDEPRGTPLSWPDFLDLQRSSTLCETLFVSKITGTTLSIGDRAERTTGSIVSANYFDAIGVSPMLGRGFLPGEDQGQSAHPVAVISYQLWRGRFRGDPQIIGKTERLDGAVHTIVGVAPEGFYGNPTRGSSPASPSSRLSKSSPRSRSAWKPPTPPPIADAACDSGPCGKHRSTTPPPCSPPWKPCSSSSSASCSSPAPTSAICSSSAPSLAATK